MFLKFCERELLFCISWCKKNFYLIKIYKQGYGFDTFQGIPEDWDDLEKGSYSSDGAIPSVEGGTFIAGDFDKTLPTFFSKERPKASLINIDSDLYSSAKSVLVHARRIIDEFTVIVFDQFLMNEHWENDEKRALEEFCAEENMGYEVIAVSLFTKQVAVKLSKLAVENLDKTNGPVRWMVTRGVWPPESGDFEDLQELKLIKEICSQKKTIFFDYSSLN